MVKRYAYGSKALMVAPSIYEEEHGEYVLFDDYDAIRSALRECVEAMNGISCYCGDNELGEIFRKAREVLGDD